MNINRELIEKFYAQSCFPAVGMWADALRGFWPMLWAGRAQNRIL